MRRLVPLLLGSLALAGVASADDALRARTIELLSAYEEPADAADWQRLGPAAGAELYAIARDATMAPSRRARAVHALGWFPSDEHRVYLAGLAADEAGDTLLRRSAVHALANGWGDAAVPTLATALKSDDVQLRAQTAKALGRVATPAAKQALTDRLAVEKSATVRDAIGASLGGK